MIGKVIMKTGKKPGTANISVSSQDGSQLTATAVVTVKEVIPIDKITLSEPGYDMMIGDKTLINCLLEPIDASVGLLSWSTTNDRVATVDADGLVTAVGAGEAEIIAQDPLSGLSASIAVKVVGEGVVSLSLSYVRNQDELKALGWGFGQTPASVNFDAEGMTVNMSLQSNSKYRADLKMASNDRPVVLNIGTYRYLAFRMDVPGNGSLKLDTNKGDYGNNPTGVLAEDSQVIYYDLQAKPYFPTDAPSDKLTTFQLKIADVTVQPYSYKVYWVRTFKTLEDLKVYVEKENNK